MNIRVEINTVYKNTESPLKAVASVFFDDCFVIRNVKVIETNADDGPFVSMPSYRGKDEQWHGVCYPVSAEFREEMKTAVLAAYHEA